MECKKFLDYLPRALSVFVALSVLVNLLTFPIIVEYFHDQYTMTSIPVPFLCEHVIKRITFTNLDENPPHAIKTLLVKPIIIGCEVGWIGLKFWILDPIST